MDGEKIKKKLLNYARDYAFEKINKTLDKKLASANGNQSQNSEDEHPRTSIGGRPHTTSSKKMSTRSSRHVETAGDRRSAVDDEVVIRSLRRPRVRLTRDQRDRFSRVRSDGDSCLEEDEGDEDDVSTRLMMSRQTSGKQRGSIASVQKHSPRDSPSSNRQSRVRSERGSSGFSHTSHHAPPHLIASQGEFDAIVLNGVKH